MPSYNYECPDCAESFERFLSIQDRDSVVECPVCGTVSEKRVAGTVGGVLKGDGWPGKNIRCRADMSARRERVGRKEEQIRRDGPMLRLAPNVDGEEVDSWSEAQRLAASKGKDTALYADKARQEKNL